MTIHNRIELDGKTYVVLPLEDYDALRAGAEDEAAGLAAQKTRDADMAAGRHLTMPRDQWARIRAGESPVKVVREYRGHTQAALSDLSGIARPEISAIEKGGRRGTVDTLSALARALGAPLDVIATKPD